jgi:predicted DNA-binding antitoxin AbrB/MazE fold protein
MAMTIEAVYENGVFRPLTPVKLDEGQRVQIYLPWAPNDVTAEEVRETFQKLQEACSQFSDEEWAEISKSWKRSS